MAREKREKRKIVKRPAGLVIPVPAPRPTVSDDPSRKIFQQAAEAERAQNEAITAVPQYRSTAPPLDAETTEDTTVSGKTTTPVPEYRSTGVSESQKFDTQTKQTPASSPIPSEKFYRKANATADHLDRALTPAESKVLDHLVRLSVGFNKEHCQVRVSTLQQRTGYRSDKTVRAALIGLEMKGIISRLTHHNNPLGDEYRIHAYSGTGVPQYRSTAVENTAVLESKITGHLKTIVKDIEKTDDDAFADLNKILSDIVKELTAKETSSAERERWGELGELLVMELKIAAARTTNISSVPAFLTEHLRRRLWKMDKKRESADENPESAGSATLQLTPEQVKNCPDCGGTGFYYPNGYEAGVTRCKHENAAGVAQ
ncbi:MAG TPA: hypothetical protein VF666_10235 [Pyrinomonadaceae bacterium]|jgi:hypothetical protein